MRYTVTVVDEHRPWPCDQSIVALAAMMAVDVVRLERLRLDCVLATGNNSVNGRDIDDVSGYETRKQRIRLLMMSSSSLLMFLLVCGRRRRHLYGLGVRSDDGG